MTHENNDTPESSTPLIYARLSAIMAGVGPVAKDQKNQQQNYKYRGIDDIYNELHSAMAKHQVFTIPEVLETTREEKRSGKGNILLYTILKVRYIFYTIDGSSVSATVSGEGMDSGDKSSNKAMAAAHKYALLQIFMIPTDEVKDSEADSHTVANIEWITPEQTADLQALVDEVGANLGLFLKYMKAQSLARIQTCDYKRAVAALEAKRAK